VNEHFGINRSVVTLGSGEKVPSALGGKGHSAITVTGADLDELVQAMGATGLSSEPGAPCRRDPVVLASLDDGARPSRR